ncbi:hypothetical protein J2Z83_001133 [Virgibacillus natechei]|uniref:Uncharacterized protein n=1 Tax=Virgibacillus natechei TaxID=1216297 RepID=A0ABS4IDP7_9BACI|nr:hypothetical protein [Virgibacillus natechei]MBP1969030.1 hypothetical protein [Virgibacillus natechei]UZD14304.1 hypothetical protein OLD84_07300 [Virgibacillus natechei]
MTILVDNCNHWIGFHIVNDLLLANYTVNGIGDENKNLSMFLGRNSSFEFVGPDVKKNYDTAISIGNQLASIQSDRTLIINAIHEQKDNEVTIKAPLLFGEWMPMDEHGLYRNNERITFDSNYFKTEAIYIKDFTNGLLQWLKAEYLPSSMDVESVRNKVKKNVKLESSIYISDNRPIEENLENVLEHYHLYKSFHEC